jgi:hypothetical protein
MPSMYDSEFGYFFGYTHNVGVDAPQRFGNKPFFDWSFGDSEIRYTWKTLTIGFGTQTIWLGPSYLYPILHSNNAPPYPKLDIGLRKQRIVFPFFNKYIGDVEARLWTGRLTESNYFDNDPANNYTMINGFAFAYSPSFLPGLTIFFNWVNLLPWKWENLKYILPIDTSNKIEDDMKSSIGFSWLFPQVGVEVFADLGVDDYVAGGRLAGFIRRPNHTTVFNLGLKKTLTLNQEKNIYGEFLTEFNFMEKTLDFFSDEPYSFYCHHLLVHGYTNEGQWLGNAASPMGNSQNFRFTVYYPKGNSSLTFSRHNSNNHYIYYMEYITKSDIYKNAYWANINIDISSVYYFTKYFQFMGGFTYNIVKNPNYVRYVNDRPSDDTFISNISFQTRIKMIL